MSEREVYLTARVPGKLRQILKAHISRDTHMNESEFIREAVREKLHREAGDLFESIIKNDQEGKPVRDSHRRSLGR